MFDINLTRAAIQLFEKKAVPTNFFSGRFKDNKPTNQTLLTLDIVREEEDIAVDVVVGTGAANFRKHEPLVNKEFMPPEYNEAYFMHADAVRQRVAGANVYKEVDRNAVAALHISKSLRKSMNRIKRSMELQAVEIFDNGTITLVGGESLDYKMKATHKRTRVADWSNPASDAFKDLEDSADVNREDGLRESDLLIMGQNAIRNFLKNNAMKDQLNFRRANLADIQAPSGSKESGGKFHGLVSIGPYTYQLWSYPQFYRSEAGTKFRYMPLDKVFIMSSETQLDTKWGAINRFADANAEGAKIAGMSSAIASSKPVRFAPYVFLSKEGTGLKVGVRSRPLLIPTEMDTFVSLYVGA